MFSDLFSYFKLHAEQYTCTDFLHLYYLCLIEVFDANTVYNSSKSSGLLCLMENTSKWFQKTASQTTRDLLPLD